MFGVSRLSVLGRVVVDWDLSESDKEIPINDDFFRLKIYLKPRRFNQVILKPNYPTSKHNETNEKKFKFPSLSPKIIWFSDISTKI